MSRATERSRPMTGDPREDLRGCEHPAPWFPSPRGGIEPRGRRPPEAHADQRPEGTITLAEALIELAAILPRLADALDRQFGDRPHVGRLTDPIEDPADALEVSRRSFERARRRPPA